MPKFVDPTLYPSAEQLERSGGGWIISNPVYDDRIAADRVFAELDSALPDLFQESSLYSPVEWTVSPQVKVAEESQKNAGPWWTPGAAAARAAEWLTSEDEEGEKPFDWKGTFESVLNFPSKVFGVVLGASARQFWQSLFAGLKTAGPWFWLAAGVGIWFAWPFVRDRAFYGRAAVRRGR